MPTIHELSLACRLPPAGSQAAEHALRYAHVGDRETEVATECIGPVIARV